VSPRWAAPDGEDLRRAALSALGPHSDERARDAVVHGSITLVAGVGRWVGSGGPVEALRVLLALDARRLGAVRAAPGVADALCAGFAAAVATHPGEALLDLVLRWDPEGRPSAAAYRDCPPAARRTPVHEALLDYLDARGDAVLARSLGHVEMDPMDRAGVTLRVDRPTGNALRADRRAMAALTAALQDLLADHQAQVRLD
jgi:hypothetical protein